MLSSPKRLQQFHFISAPAKLIPQCNPVGFPVLINIPTSRAGKSSAPASLQEPSQHAEGSLRQSPGPSGRRTLLEKQGDTTQHPAPSLRSLQPETSVFNLDSDNLSCSWAIITNPVRRNFDDNSSESSPLHMSPQFLSLPLPGFDPKQSLLFSKLLIYLL